MDSRKQLVETLQGHVARYRKLGALTLAQAELFADAQKLLALLEIEALIGEGHTQAAREQIVAEVHRIDERFAEAASGRNHS